MLSRLDFTPAEREPLFVTTKCLRALRRLRDRLHRRREERSVAQWRM